MLAKLESDFRRLSPRADFCSLRYYRSREESLSVRQDVPQPIERDDDDGVMITVFAAGGAGYAATSDLSPSGLKAALDEAQLWARRTAGRCVVDLAKLALPHPTGEYRGPRGTAWESLSVADKFDLLMAASRRLKTSDAIADWAAGLWHAEIETLYLTTGSNSAGARVSQRVHRTGPSLRATASRGAQAQTRSLGGFTAYQQGGLEVMGHFAFRDAPEQIAREALELLDAPNCPTGPRDVLLAPDQMALQIHESIGHPLELDRILGDERNFAGTSFVTPDMLGSYRYGSDLLNITFDPTRPEQFASYGYDDDGLKAEKKYLIRNGILERALGGAISQARAGHPGVANSRACSWNRPPIDRMANLNLEPGTSSLESMIAGIRHGIYLRTNNSWSIDDSRNKFQFGCEWGRLIEDGKLTAVVRNPSYRGISATFWRSLKAVGDPSTLSVMGVPNCGKGEPNQMIHVAHASPPCLFADVEVFGGV